MPKDFSAVGNSAVAAKNLTGLSGDEKFTSRINMKDSDNGGYIVSLSYEKTRKGDKRGDVYPCGYCDKELTFATLDQVFEAIRAAHDARK